jgi:ligand-binding SRPBCC domain-containing protein
MTAPAPIQRVFGFFEDPRNLGRITPPWLNFKIVDPDKVRMRAGAEIDYVIRWQGLPMKWKTVIRRYDPPFSFVDEQERGPYTLWHHEHTFAETAEGVVIRDQVDYKLPLGVLGEIAHAVMVKRQLLEIFRFRQKAIAEMLAVPGITFDDPKVTRIS